MKMTRLEWRYLQKVALDHPHFDTHKLPLTEKEAKAIVEANNRMTGREFVDSIYAKLGMTRPAEEKKHFAWLHSLSELITVPPIRKIAIAVLVVILMTVFFAATPTGRAIAESVIQYIVTLFEDKTLVLTKGDNELSMVSTDSTKDEIYSGERQDIQSDFVHIDSVDTFINNTGKIPFILPMIYSELYYEYDASINYLTLYATYPTPNGDIIAYQIWGAEKMVSSTLEGYSVCDEDTSVYYSIEDNGDLYCVKVFEDSVFTVLSNENYSSLETLIDMMRDR